MKPPDLCATIACSACHDWMDGRVRHRGISEQDRETLVLNGLVRFLCLVAKEGEL